MKKMKINQKELKKAYNNILCCGYCELCYLLKYQEPRFYNGGIYGWNFDAYEYDFNTILTTGYRPIGKRIDTKICKEYNEKARNILIDNKIDYNNKIFKIEILFQEFIEKVKNI